VEWCLELTVYAVLVTVKIKFANRLICENSVRLAGRLTWEVQPFLRVVRPKGVKALPERRSCPTCMRWNSCW
jgi:hypothetical protein